MHDLITTFLDGRTLTDFYTVLGKNWFGYVVDFSTILIGIATVITLLWNWKTNRKQVFQARFNFLFQQYQSISILSEETQKSFHQNIIKVTRAGNNADVLKIVNDNFKQHYYQIRNMLVFINQENCIDKAQKQEMLNLFYTLIPNVVLWNMAILMLKQDGDELKKIAEKYRLLNMLELPFYKDNEDVLPTLDNEIKHQIGVYVEYAELGCMFTDYFSSEIFGENKFSIISKEILGISLFQNKNYQQAFEKLEQIADTGSYIAQTAIGIMFTGDKYLGVDNPKAEHYLMSAAKQGYRIAQYNLARFYHLNQKLEDAVYWYELAGNQNYEFACKNVAEIYFDEKYSGYSIEKAKFWADKCAALKTSGICAIKYQIDYFLKNGERMPTSLKHITGEN